MPALLVVAVLVLTAIGQNMRAHERVLDERGVIGLAGVVESEGGPKRFPKVVVDYRVGDASFRTTLRVLSADEFEVGSTIAIVYDPIHPEHARPVEGWGPRSRPPPLSVKVDSDSIPADQGR